MANLGNEIKTFLFKGLEAIGDAAANIGATAKQKLNEMKLENRRDDLRRQIPGAALQHWKDGEPLPEQLSELLSELNNLNEQLSAMKAKSEPQPEEPQEGEAAPATFEEAMETLEDKVEQAAEAVEDWMETKADAAKEAVKDAFTPDEEETYEPIELDETTGDNA